MLNAAIALILLLSASGSPTLWQLAPLVVIVVLIIAAAGISRGMDIFAVFGIGSLLSIGGAGAGGAGKGLRSAGARARTKAMMKEYGGGVAGMAGAAKGLAGKGVKAGKAKIDAARQSRRQTGIEEAIGRVAATGYHKSPEGLIKYASDTGMKGATGALIAVGVEGKRQRAVASAEHAEEMRKNVESLGAEASKKESVSGMPALMTRTRLGFAQWRYGKGMDEGGKVASRGWFMLPLIRVPLPNPSGSGYLSKGALATAASDYIAYEKALYALAKEVNATLPMASVAPPAPPPIPGGSAGSTTGSTPGGIRSTSGGILAPPNIPVVQPQNKLFLTKIGELEERGAHYAAVADIYALALIFRHPMRVASELRNSMKQANDEKEDREAARRDLTYNSGYMRYAPALAGETQADSKNRIMSTYLKEGEKEAKRRIEKENEREDIYNSIHGGEQGQPPGGGAGGVGGATQ